MRRRAFLTAFILSVFGGYALTLFAENSSSVPGLSTTQGDSTARAVTPSTDKSDTNLVPVANESSSEASKNPETKEAKPAPKEKPDTDPEFTNKDVKKKADAERKARADKKAAAEKKGLAKFKAEQKARAVTKPGGAPAGVTVIDSFYGEKKEKSPLDAVLGNINDAIGAGIFFDLAGGAFKLPKKALESIITQKKTRADKKLVEEREKYAGLRFIVIWLILGALFFTIRFGFINFRILRHSVRCVRGKYSKPGDKGETSHFQALTMALSATVGLGNIAGVAIAIGIGGPGATFWMIVAGLLAMTTKFVEASLAQMYRVERPDGHVMGGAMEYLSRGFKEKGMASIGKVLAVIFAILCIGAALGGGNAFQVNQSLNAVQVSIPFFQNNQWVYGAIMATLVGLVIIGGVKRIAQTAAGIVPLMVLIYVGASLWIIFANIDAVPAAFSTIFSSAFNTQAGIGGFVGVIIIGFQRAAFSNEAGIGSAAIAHATAKTAYPVREGMVALLEPFIDTVIICTMTALVIVISGYYASAPGVIEKATYMVFNDSAFTAVTVPDLIAHNQGAKVTSLAFGNQISWFPHVMAICVFLFAFSTMISWFYYGERCWTYMFHEKSAIIFKLMFVSVVVLGSIASSGAVIDFSDALLLSMAIPNIIGLYLLHGKVVKALKDYISKLKSGELDREVGRT